MNVESRALQLPQNAENLPFAYAECKTEGTIKIFFQ